MLIAYDYACPCLDAELPLSAKYETVVPLGDSDWFRYDDSSDQPVQSPEWSVTPTTLCISDVSDSVQAAQPGAGDNFLSDLNHLMCSLSEHTRMTNQIASDTKSIEQFSFILSHKLRAPIANALGLAELLDGGLLTGLERENCQKHLCASVRQIDKEIRAMNDVVSNYRIRMNEF